ncbi:putative fructokinase [Helianthus annuus]|nr:putative fructokinase [Helianthus annuus]KAJ0883160.1 putative fructokinase [Helianthus annuus]
MLIDFVPTINYQWACASFQKKHTPANDAVGIAQGLLAAFIGKVGEDEFGYMLADILKENNANNEGM